MDDPRTAGVMALAAGLLHGDYGSGLAGYSQAYQGAQDGLLNRTDKLQQMQLRNLQLQQAQQEWQLQQPLLAAAVARLKGGQAPDPSAPQQPPQPGMTAPQGGGMGAGIPGLGQAPSGAAPMAARSGGSMLPGVPDDVAMWNIGAGGIKAIPALLNEYNKPTDFQRMLTAGGIDPQSALGRQLIQSNLAKQNYIAPVNARPGSILRDPNDPTKVLAFNPQIPEGTAPQFDANGNVTAFQPIANAEPAIALANRAKTFGKAQATPTVAYGPDGTPVFSTGALDVQRATGAMPPPQAGVQGSFMGDPAKAMEDVMGIKDPQERANAMQALSQQIRQQGNVGGNLSPVQRPGVVQGATLSQDELSKKGTTLMSANENTNTVISRLQNIKMLAPGAITGAENSRRDFFNGLLSLGGIKGAEDAKTASDLVDKNASQIVSALRLGSGGGGTDALQTLLGAANPNRHMTKEAMMDAADQLIASQKMIQDKAKVLNPHYMARDPVAYGTKELAFDQNADPRVWQLQSMNPQQQASYVKTLPADVARELLTKRQALKQLGVLQ